jgi:hypothetical protein
MKAAPAAFFLFSGVVDIARGANEMSWFDPKNIIQMNRPSTYLTDAECLLP